MRTEQSDFSKLSEVGFFWKKRCVFRKKPWIFQKSLVLTYAVECDGISKFSQKPRKNLSFFEKKCGFFKKKTIFRNWLEVAILLYNATETLRSLKTFKSFLESRWISCTKNLEFFVNWLKKANLPKNWLSN